MRNYTLVTFITRLKQNMFAKRLTPKKKIMRCRAFQHVFLRSAPPPRYLAYAIIILTAMVCANPQICNSQTGKQHYGISIAVLPFEVFSVEKEPTLGAEVADLIAKQLALNPAIIMVETQQVKTVMQPDDSVAMTEARLRQLAKLLNANCIIMGTVTKIRAEHSIDVEMFNTASSGPNYKTYSEGLEIKSLVETITTALEQEIMGKAERIPETERPKVSAGRQQSPQTSAGGFDVERELLAAFGPMKEDSKKSPEIPSSTAVENMPAAPAPKEGIITDEHTTAAPAPNEEITTDERTTAAIPDARPSGALPDDKAARKEEKRGQVKKNSLGNEKDPGFFSLSKAISINADTMEYDNRSNRAIFKGNVVARQDDIVMFANAMHVYYSEGGGLSMVDAQGNVRVVQGDRIATGSSIVFNNANQTIVATGDPRVWQGDNVVHGKKITVYLKEERTVVEGEPNSRASATIYPDSDKKKP